MRAKSWWQTFCWHFFTIFKFCCKVVYERTLSSTYCCFKKYFHAVFWKKTIMQYKWQWNLKTIADKIMRKYRFFFFSNAAKLFYFSLAIFSFKIFNFIRLCVMFNMWASTSATLFIFSRWRIINCFGSVHLKFFIEI